MIGRFLSTAHFHFNDGAEDVLSSRLDGAQFLRRIELCFPVLDPRLKQRVIKEGLRAPLADNSQAWEMDPDGNYQRRRSHGRLPRPSQEQLLGLLAAR